MVRVKCAGFDVTGPSNANFDFLSIPNLPIYQAKLLVTNSETDQPICRRKCRVEFLSGEIKILATDDNGYLHLKGVQSDIASVYVMFESPRRLLNLDEVENG